MTLTSLKQLPLYFCPVCHGAHADRTAYLCRGCDRVLCAAQTAGREAAYLHPVRARDGSRAWCGPLLRCEVTVDLAVESPRRRA